MGADQLAASSLFVRSNRGFSAPWATSVCMIAADFCALSLTYWLAVLSRYVFGGKFHLDEYLQFFPAIILFIAGFAIQDLYPGLLLHPAEELRRVFRCVTIVMLVIAASTFLRHNAATYSRAVFLILWAAGAPLVLLTRHYARATFSGRPWWGVAALLLGSGPAARRITRAKNIQRLGLRVAGALTDDPSQWPTDLPGLLGGIEAAPELARRGVAEYAIVSMPHLTSAELQQVIQEHCIGFRHVLLLPDFPGMCSLHISAREVGGEVALEMPQGLFHRDAALIKSALDVIGSGIILLALLPLFAVISIAIRARSRGPIFFGHSRFGRDGKIFNIWKFRTMVADADQVLHRHLEQHPEALEEWTRDHKLKDDPRVTRVGKWLRRYSLDELPQLWNVFMGEMSLVGPRPIVMAEIEKYGRAYGLYKRAVPGLTGLWQVSGRNNTTYNERIALDEYYIRNWSVWLDAYILARTVQTVVTGHGAY